MVISEFIYSWLKDIVVLFIIITLVDLIMPRGQLKRYMNFIIGLILIFMVISPFLKLLSLDFKLENTSIDRYGEQDAYDIDFTKEQTDQIEALYTEKISSEIEILIEKESSYKVNDMSVNIDKAELNFGDITGIDIELIKNDQEKKTNNIHKVNISKIEKISNNKKEESIQNNNEQFNNLKKIISEELGISMDLIIIYANT